MAIARGALPGSATTIRASASAVVTGSASSVASAGTCSVQGAPTRAAAMIRKGTMQKPSTQGVTLVCALIPICAAASSSSQPIAAKPATTASRMTIAAPRPVIRAVMREPPWPGSGFIAASNGKGARAAAAMAR